MIRSSVTPIGKILKTYFAELGIEDKMDEQRVLDALPTVAGPYLCKFIQRKYISNKILYLHITNSILKGEISMNKASLMERLNNAANPGRTVIEDIVVR